MSKIVPFETAAVPAHIAAMQANGPQNTDLSSGVGLGSYPIISYKGKVWHVVIGDDRTLVVNDEGEPKSSIEVVILKANPALSKIYYEGGYEEGSTAKPTCYSNDSIEPAPDAQEKQFETCGGCPHNAWGSRITDSGGKGKACTDARRLAVAPIGELDKAMLLRVPAASLKELTVYADTLNKRGAPYTAVVTKISFDHTVAHPKFVFKPLRWLEESEMAAVTEMLENQILGAITGVDSRPATQPLQIEGKPPANAPKAAAPIAGEKKPAAAKAATPKPAAAKKAKEPEPEPEAVAAIDDTDAIMAQADDALNEALANLDD